MKVLLVSFIALFSLSMTYAEEPKVPFEAGTKAEVLMSKPTKIKGGDWDDKLQQISPRIKLTSINAAQNYEGYKGSLIVIGQSALEPKVYSVLLRHDYTFSLPTLKTVEEEAPTFSTRYDTTGSKFGYKYDGWVLIVKDPSGKIVFTKATSVPHEKLPQEADKLVKGSYFDKKLEKAIAPRL